MAKLTKAEAQAVQTKLIWRYDDQKLKYPASKITLAQSISANLSYALRNARNQKDRLSPENFAEYLRDYPKSGWEFPDKNGIWPKL